MNYLSKNDCIIFVKNHTQLWPGVAQLAGHCPSNQRMDSQSGHLPGLQVPSLVGVHKESSQLMFLSHIDVSLPFFLSPFPSL